MNGKYYEDYFLIKLPINPPSNKPYMQLVHHSEEKPKVPS
ncbi:hypothetical protein SAMN05216365_12249 [Porphyromonadaceae bacterium NLAE-zl-C104]|nr:hypothetical protein SAMN05216365_12249 [Porphyromonadaceae bacterium NLAE-zl-C104]